MFHYVYKLIDRQTKQFYFGSRTCDCDPKQDEYMGSPVTWDPEYDRLNKIILKDNFETREEAIEYEANLIKKNLDNNLNENYYIPNKGFHGKANKNTVSVYNKNGDTFKVSVNNPKYLSGEYKSVTTNINKGLATVKDKNDNYFKVSVNDPRLKSGELTGVTKGREPWNKNKIRPRMSGSKNPNAKPIRHILSGKIFDTVKEAADHFDISTSTVREHCNKRLKRKKPSFEYI